MFGLPDDFDCDFLLGRILEQICINENTIYFHFDNRVFITVESAYAYVGSERGAGEQLSEIPTFDVNVLRLLGSSVREATGTSDGTLILMFETGQALKIFDTSRQYESYKIDFNDKTIVV